MSAATDYTVTNLELRESNPDGSEGAGLAHRAEGLFLLHVKELASAGEPRGCVTVLHDAGGHGGRYLELARRLASDGWAVALPDLRGHGSSEGDRGHSWGIKEVVRDVDSVQDHLAYRLPETPQVLVGQGLGALYALAYARERPGRAAALVLCAPLLEPRFEVPEEKGGLMKLFKKVGPTSPGRTLYRAEQLSSDPEQAAAWTADPLVHDVVTKRAAESIAETARACREGGDAPDLPVLVLQGSADPIADPALAARVSGPRVEREVLEGRLHDLLHERGSAELVARIAGWLDAVVPR